MSSMNWVRHVFGRNPQSVVDFSGSELRHEDSVQVELAANLARPPALPVDADGCTGFQDLPEELLEHIFSYLQGSSRRNHFAVCGVSRSWRCLGQRLFFARPWNTPHLICHPNQLFCLSPHVPSGSRSGLLKCFVRRERCASDGSVQGRRITFYLGKDAQQPHRARFLLCALQRGRHSTHLYLNSRGEGAPCARLTSNLLCTGYTLTLEESSMPGAPGSLTDDSLVFYPGCGPSNSHPGHMRRASVDSDGMLPWYSNSPPGAMQHPAEGGTEEIRTEMSLASAPSASGVDGGSKGKVPADGASAPPVLLTLQYKARLKGLMQPRRMDVALPDPAQAAGAAYMAQQPGPAGARRQAALNALTQVSAVAVLETPAGTPESASSLGPASPSNDVPVVAGEEPLPAEFPDGGARYAPKPSGGALRSLLCGGGLLRSARTAPEEAAPLPVHLHNKSPHWNDGLRCWCLNFRGRVKLASVKNFQLVRTEDAAEKVVMQFGKIDEDTFILDFNPMAMSAVQAFSIALSTFDGKVML